MDIIDNEYLLKALAEMVRDENNRIISAGLATPEDIGRLASYAAEIIAKETNRPNMLLDTLSVYHKILSAIKLPGDFKEISTEVGSKEESKNKLDEVLEDVNKKEDENKEEGFSEEYEIVVAEVINRLEKIAYNLGSRGNHDAAYMVERCVNEIKCAEKNIKVSNK